MDNLSNLCAEIVLPFTGNHLMYYKVDRDFPYNCLKVNGPSERASHSPFNKYSYFETRLEAMKESYSLLMETAKCQDTIMYNEFKSKLENIEEEHPEWLI